ncbi:hypothetical protein PAK_P100083 [Pseudomonas phage PAK_P1]|uniref:Uncharacterized protein n=5 Tax=Pakpunavirus TaxID=1921407 RepID=D4N4A9_9CAUD|nr:hypothetical protein PAK_P100083 [Pseudomonas phage PAK_P1]YP_007236527.1 hypothetical protein PaP1_gp116 [Pseudomonas phage PaP1]YP_009200070.1 hypothetical protein K8_134 [Pseudomonas phage K8]YP_009273888.1 hypothetical protein BH773_gp095 [Pseudomonas phage K5]YP_010762675.1 hypothetical protein QE325_gp092 [Pseudomonas phage pPA-3099-2aT.2]YP_010763209.1 hypothetical protein QE329_gp049 [Pseudomonas phage PhL_UNISO_PA-DSM_ph0034]YP_010763469.1 hypothetical protein QE330_gp081 [Pseudom
MEQTIDKIRYIVLDNEQRHVLTLCQLAVHNLLRGIQWTRDKHGQIHIHDVTGVELGVRQGIIAEVFLYPGYTILEETEE